MRPEDLKRSFEDHMVLDVREQEEWDAGHIDGSLHIPMDQVPERADQIPTDRMIACVCRSGSRSDLVARYLNREGRRAENLDGGLQAWRQGSNPLVTDDGRPGTVV